MSHQWYSVAKLIAASGFLLLGLVLLWGMAGSLIKWLRDSDSVGEPEIAAVMFGGPAAFAFLAVAACLIGWAYQ